MLATRLGRPLFLVAESDLNDPRFVRSRDAGGLGIDATWADEWHHALHAALSGDRSGYYEDFGSLALLAKALRQAWVYDGQWSPHRQRSHGRPPTGLAGYQFVVCTQNHDQVGNRAMGERASALMSDGRLRIAAALLLTGPFTPDAVPGRGVGRHLAVPVLHRPPRRRARRGRQRGRRNEFVAFGWDPDEVPDPQALGTFEASKLQWNELEQPAHSSLLAWYRELIALRRRIPALSDPRLSTVAVEVDEADNILVVHRGNVSLYVNLGERPRRFASRPDGAVLAASDRNIRIDGGRVVVPLDAVALLMANED